MKIFRSIFSQYLLCAVLLVSLALSVRRVSAQNVEAEIGVGNVVGIDDFTDQLLHSSTLRSASVSWMFPSAGRDTSAYAHDFGYPVFSAGVALKDYSNVTLHHPGRPQYDYMSKMGRSVVLYGAFRRSMFRSRNGLSADYTFENGMGINSHPYSRHDNEENELVGSYLSVYFGVKFQLAWRVGHWEIAAGPSFRHLSNGALSRPNKGVNSLEFGITARHYATSAKEERKAMAADSIHRKWQLKIYPQLSYRPGFHKSKGEWLVDNNSGGNPQYGHYKMYVAHTMSLDLMARYARRYASGIGVDLMYEPYARSIETQNGVVPSDMSKWSVGIAARHEVFYKQVSIPMCFGYYVSRPFAKYANTAEEFHYYERIGVSYHPRFMKNRLSIGYSILAHRTIAYLSEITMTLKY